MLKEDNLKIDILKLFQLVINLKKYIIYFTLCSLIVGLVINYNSKDIYESKSTFVPQVGKGGDTQSLGGLAALAGINLSGMNNEFIIPLTLYKMILNSPSIKIEILNSNIILGGDTIKYRDYLFNLEKINYNKVSNFSNEQLNNLSEPVKISLEESMLFSKIENNINLEIVEDQGYVLLTTLDEIPEIAYQLNLIVFKILQDKIIDFRIKKSKDHYEYIVIQYNKKKEEVTFLEDEFSNLIDRNLNLSSSFYSNQINRIENEIAINKSIFIELSKQKQNMELEIEKNTPIFFYIDTPLIPTDSTKTNIFLILILYTLLGILTSILSILIRQAFLKIKNQL
jgi:hypothetical protein